MKIITPTSSLHVEEWKTRKEKIRILCVHGMAAYHGYFRIFANIVNKNGISVFGLDLRGYGKSRGFVKNMNNWAEDIHYTVEEIYNGKPLFLMGHSMGSINILNYMRIFGGENISGLILASPGTMMKLYPKPTINLPKILLNSLFFPDRTADIISMTHRIPEDRVEMEEVMNNKFCPTTQPYRYFRYYFFLEILSYITAPKIRKPVLVISGKKDEITSWESQVILSSLFKKGELILLDEFDHRLNEFLTLTTTKKEYSKTRTMLANLITNWVFEKSGINN